MKKKVFVLGASGFQGGNIAQELLANNYNVTTIKRAKNNGNPTHSSVNVIEGSLDSKEILSEALKGSNAAVFNFPLIFDLDLVKTYTQNFIEAAKTQNVPLIINNVGFDLPNKATELLALNIKTTIKTLFDTSGLNVITLVPDIYIDNISAPWSIPVIQQNAIVPYPIASSVKVPWISHTDLAKYVTAAVSKPNLAGQILYIGGNLFTGDEITAAIADEIGKPLNYVPMTPDDFEQQISPAFGAIAGKEISNLYRYIETYQAELISKDYTKSQALLNVQPQSLTDWVKSVNWTA